ncbi:MAG: LamG domain-containing protein, partial [Bifidobacterium bifidum]|nr:LamG domain-containing protein [Bifidobacterium bifidum]
MAPRHGAPRQESAGVETAAGEAEGSFTVNVSAVAPDANGAVAYWDFSSVDGSTVRDASGNGYDAELWNGAAVEGGTLSLTGTQRQYLDIPVGVLGGLSGDATISAWVDLDSTSNNQMMLGAGSDKDNFFVMALNDVFRCGLNVEGAGEQRTVADSGVPAGTWAYVSYVQKGTAASLYVNGKKVATGAADHSLAAAVAKAGAFVHL